MRFIGVQFEFKELIGGLFVTLALLPRHLQMSCELNTQHLQNVREHFLSDDDCIRRMSIIGSYAVNGVAELRSELLRESMFKDFCELTPEKFQNKTSGVTFRRRLAFCNPDLFPLIVKCIGDQSIRNDCQSLKRFRQYASNQTILSRIRQIKDFLNLQLWYSKCIHIIGAAANAHLIDRLKSTQKISG